MMRKSWAFVMVTTIACAGMTVACGNDDSGDSARQDAGPGPGVDSGGGGGDGGGGGPDGGACTFASYVIGLVTTSTNATAKPDPSLGAACKETTSQAEFKSLFP